MSIFDAYFGKQHIAKLVHDYTISSGETAEEFGKVYVRKTQDKLQVQFTILMEPRGQQAEGWQTGVALDASLSMTNAYGRELIGQIPEAVIKEYERKKWVRYQHDDGQQFRIFERLAVEDAINKGYFRYTENIVEPVARKFISYLAHNLDTEGKTRVIYWACGDGSKYEEVGHIGVEECEALSITGPKEIRLGSSTQLRPALEYYINRPLQAKRNMYIFITDGYLDDLEAVKRYTVQFAKQIQRGQRNLTKCILIGVGKEVNERQMMELDDLDTGTKIDIWDHKLASHMRHLIEIFAELVDEHHIVAPMATVFDSDNQLVKKFVDGLPAKVTIELPVTTKWFELEVMGKRIRQMVLPSSN